MKGYLSGKKITLDDLLDRREARVLIQERLLYSFEGAVLLSVTMNIPGDIKTWGNLEEKFREITGRIIKDTGLIPLLTREDYLSTGPECFMIFMTDPLYLKSVSVKIEEEDAMGRLCDLDVLTVDGKISRKTIGRSPRRCFLCDKDAFICRREGNHDPSEILKSVTDVVDGSKQSD